MLKGYIYEDGKRVYSVRSQDMRGRIAGEVCECQLIHYFTAYCQKGTENADLICSGGSIRTDCNTLYADPIELGTPDPTQMGYRCSPWERNFVGQETVCHYVEDPSNGDDYDYGPGGDSGSGEIQPYDVDKIRKELDDPCFSNRVNSVIANINSNSAIQDFVRKYGGSTNKHITFKDVHISGVTASAMTTTDPNQPGSYIIYLDPIVNYDASNEYVVSVIYHEIVHVMLFANGVDQLNNFHHERMVEYVDDLVNVIWTMYPDMSKIEVEALVWAGSLSTNSTWNNFTQDTKDYYRQIRYDHVHQSQPQATQNYDLHRTPCF